MWFCFAFASMLTTVDAMSIRTHHHGEHLWVASPRISTVFITTSAIFWQRSIISHFFYLRVNWQWDHQFILFAVPWYAWIRFSRQWCQDRTIFSAWCIVSSPLVLGHIISDQTQTSKGWKNEPVNLILRIVCNSVNSRCSVVEAQVFWFYALSPRCSDYRLLRVMTRTHWQKIAFNFTKSI